MQDKKMKKKNDLADERFPEGDKIEFKNQKTMREESGKRSKA